MKPDFFSQLAERRAEAIAKLDAETFAPAIRNHLVQLFRKAHAVEPSVTGVKTGNGSGIATGTYLKLYEDNETMADDCHKWSPFDNAQPKHAETRAFLAAVQDYSDRLCSGRADELPYIADITPADLETTGAKKAAIHGPRGLRARMAR